MKKILICMLVLALALALTGCRSGDYRKAQKLFEAEEYDEASRLYASLSDYKDSAEKLKECRYQQACQAFSFLLIHASLTPII